MMPTITRMLRVLLIASTASAVPAVSSNFLGRHVQMQSAQVHALPHDIRALAGATEDINGMDHDVKSLLGTFDTFLAMLVLPFLAPFFCMFVAAREEKNVHGEGRASEEVSLLS